MREEDSPYQRACALGCRWSDKIQVTLLSFNLREITDSFSSVSMCQTLHGAYLN